MLVRKRPGRVTRRGKRVKGGQFGRDKEAIGLNGEGIQCDRGRGEGDVKEEKHKGKDEGEVNLKEEGGGEGVNKEEKV